MLTLVAGRYGSHYAAQQAAAQLSKQNKIDLMLDNYQRKLLSEQQRRKLGNAAIALQVLVERKVTFEWRFP